MRREILVIRENLFLGRFELAMSITPTAADTAPTAAPTAVPTALPVAYRCSRCFQVRCSTVDQVGQAAKCELCGHENVVPEATEDRISQGKSFLQQAEMGAVNQINLNDSSPQMTSAEFLKQSREKSIAKHGVGGRIASKTQRFLGALIDLIAMVFMFALGMFAAVTVAPLVPGEEPSAFFMAVLYGGPAILLLAQYAMTAMDGRTIGKYCLNTMVVNGSGDPPGFLRGVVMRSWVNIFLGIIPFYGFADIIWIFTNESHRCLHDLVAGTTVVEAS